MSTYHTEDEWIAYKLTKHALSDTLNISNFGAPAGVPPSSEGSPMTPSGVPATAGINAVPAGTVSFKDSVEALNSEKLDATVVESNQAILARTVLSINTDFLTKKTQPLKRKPRTVVWGIEFSSSDDEDDTEVSFLSSERSSSPTIPNSRRPFQWSAQNRLKIHSHWAAAQREHADGFLSTDKPYRTLNTKVSRPHAEGGRYSIPATRPALQCWNTMVRLKVAIGYATARLMNTPSLHPSWIPEGSRLATRIRNLKVPEMISGLDPNWLLGDTKVFFRRLRLVTAFRRGFVPSL